MSETEKGINIKRGLYLHFEYLEEVSRDEVCRIAPQAVI